MGTVRTKDGASIFYKDWGKGRPIVFSHGWPLNADAWDEQLLFFAARGYRAIAHDRRGHGRSSQPWDGNTMDTYADDLGSLLTNLELRDAILVGHSTGGGEVARYVGRHGAGSVSKLVLVGAVPPLMLQTHANPNGLPIAAFDEMRKNVESGRSDFYRGLAQKFFGANRPDAKVPQGLLDQFWLQSMQVGLKAAYDCIKAFSESDFTEDLKKIDVPTLLIHGDDDQIVPVDTSARLAAKILKKPALKLYPGAPHGLTFTHKDTFNADVLSFARD